MAAIGSFSSLLFINFLVLIGRFASHDVDGYSPNDGLNRLAAPKLWNSLPLDIRNSGSITLFKCKLKTFLLKKYYL